MRYTRAAMTFGFIFLRMSASKGAKSWRSGQSILGLRNYPGYAVGYRPGTGPVVFVD